MNAPLECFTPHSSGKVVFRVTFSEILPRTFNDKHEGKEKEQKGGTLLDAIKSVEGEYDNFMAQHPRNVTFID